MSVKYFFPLAILFLLFSCKQDEKKVEPQQSHVESSSTTYVKLKKYIDSSYLSPSEVEDSSYTNGQIYDDAVSLAKEMKGDTSVPELLFRTGALVKGRKGPTKAIGIWGQRHLDYLKQYRKVTYTNLLTSGRLNAYLADINRQAQERFERLIEGMKQAQGITEQLKAENALEWTGCLNNIRACAREIVEKEIIFA